jgi:hypothetical protein
MHSARPHEVSRQRREAIISRRPQHQEINIVARAPVLFNKLLEEAGIAPADVRLVRHHTKPGLGGQSLHDLWVRDRDGFELLSKDAGQRA